MNYLEYLDSGNILKRLFPWYPKDKYGNRKKELNNSGSTGYILGKISQLQNKNTSDEETSAQVSKNSTASNRNVGSSYVVNIPIGVRDTSFTFPYGSVTISNRIKHSSELL